MAIGKMTRRYQEKNKPLSHPSVWSSDSLSMANSGWPELKASTAALAAPFNDTNFENWVSSIALQPSDSVLVSLKTKSQWHSCLKLVVVKRQGREGHKQTWAKQNISFREMHLSEISQSNSAHSIYLSIERNTIFHFSKFIWEKFHCQIYQLAKFCLCLVISPSSASQIKLFGMHQRFRSENKIAFSLRHAW